LEIGAGSGYTAWKPAPKVGHYDARRLVGRAIPASRRQIMESEGRHIDWFAFPLSAGFNLIKVRFQRDPNEFWRKGIGFCFCNLGFCVYWDKR